MVILATSLIRLFGLCLSSVVVFRLLVALASGEPRRPLPRISHSFWMAALTAHLRELETSEEQVGELPVDASLIQLASRQASGHDAVARPS